MAGIDDQSLSDLLDGITDASALSSDMSLPLNLADVTNMDFSDLDNDFLDEFLQPFQDKQGSPASCGPPSSSSSESCQQDSMDSSASSSNNRTTSSGIPTIVTMSDQSTREHLQILEQPCQNSKLRYRADYVREKGRLGVLGNKNDASRMKGPVIRIAPCYLNPSDQYFIRVSLVTVKYPKTNLHYFHIYELEHPKDSSSNDRANNSVWFPIDAMDSTKNFPLLRIVKKKMVSIQKLDHLRVFDYYQNSSSSSSSSNQHSFNKEIDPVREYNLDRSQLVFTLGKKMMHHGQLTMFVYANTAVFSEEMTEFDNRQVHVEMDTDVPNKKIKSTTVDNQAIFDYAPRSGLVNSNEQMLVSLNKKLDLRKHGDLQITFECDTSQGRWIQTINDIKIKETLIALKIPVFPYAIRHATPVDVILRQKNSLIGVLKYSYLPTR